MYLFQKISVFGVRMCVCVCMCVCVMVLFGWLLWCSAGGGVWWLVVVGCDEGGAVECWWTW